MPKIYSKKTPNDWIKHVMKYQKKGESLKTAIQKAKKTYKKKK